MKNIITVQHTQSVHHTNGMVGSWTDWELTDLGRQQADCIGRKLSEEMRGRKVVIYSSDLMRAKQTADIIAGHFGAVPIYDERLRERNLGRCCGKSVQWLRENIECQEQTIDDRMFSDAESRRGEWDRLKPFFEEMLSDPAEDVIIVSHGDLLSAFNIMFLGLAPEVMNTADIYGLPGGVSHMSVSDSGKRKIRRISDTSYLMNN